MDEFETAFAVVVSIEGDYADDPTDPGSATKYGISAAAYPGLDIRNLSLDAAKAIYRRDYWDKNRCGEMPWRWALSVFDGAVNQGNAVRVLQRVLKTAEDGIVGPATLALLVHAVEDDFHAFLAVRAEHYAYARQFPIYGRGWLKRLFRIAQTAEHPPA